MRRSAVEARKWPEPMRRFAVGARTWPEPMRRSAVGAARGGLIRSDSRGQDHNVAGADAAGEPSQLSKASQPAGQGRGP